MYDPLTDSVTRTNQPYPASYWQQNSSEPPSLDTFNGKENCDVIIIGAGFTGLSCAKHLQEQSNASSIILDANQPGWGCSGRNAGFILPGSGRLDYSGIAQRYGTETARETISEYYAALDTIADLISFADSDCSKVTGGYLKIGHSVKAFQRLHNGLKNLPKPWQSQYEVCSATDINIKYIPDYPNFGGVYCEAGQGINPLQLAVDLTAKLSRTQQNIYGNSPILSIQKRATGYQVITPGGEVNCNEIVLASNAYSLTSLLPGITEKQFPVLSSVLVTEPLSEQQSVGWKAHLMAMDTRSLKYYFRLLPDKRILFGGRGAVSGKNANTDKSQQQLKQAFDMYFPTLSQLRSQYFWSGWVSVSADNLPHVVESQQYPGIYYGTGYCGSGLAFSCHAGKKLAEKVCGYNQQVTSPIYTKEIPSFPFARFRRLGLHLFYAWHRTFM